MKCKMKCKCLGYSNKSLIGCELPKDGDGCEVKIESKFFPIKPKMKKCLFSNIECNWKILENSKKYDPSMHDDLGG